MRALWTQEDPSFDGKYSRFAGMKFSPKPLQKPSIPVVIGGVSRAAIRRAARLGDGWQPLGMSPEALVPAIATLREEARAVRPRRREDPHLDRDVARDMPGWADTRSAQRQARSSIVRRPTRASAWTRW